MDEFQSSLKSTDTEETIDVYFYRPIGYRWALLFRPLGVHPNTVTIFSIILGVSAGILFYFNDIKLNLVGILLLMWANMYDSADGQLARLTGQKTALGRILDGFAGDLWFFAIYVSIALRLTPEWGIWIWITVLFDGFVCHARQCQLADYYRNIHLFFLKGKEGSEMDDSVGQQEKYNKLDWRTDFISKLFQFFYVRYVRAQEGMTPKFQLFKREMLARYPSALPLKLREDFREGSLPLMKYANFLTFNWRSILLALSLIVGAPWIYIAAELVLFSLVFFYMRACHEALCDRLLTQLDQYER